LIILIQKLTNGSQNLPMMEIILNGKQKNNFFAIIL
jgi:hypothetical protein